MRQDELGEVGEAKQVHFELVSGVFERDVLYCPVETETRVVDQNVDASLGIDDLAHGSLVVLTLRDIHLDRSDAVFGQVLHTIHPACTCVHGVAPTGQEDRSLPAHAGGGSGDEYDLAQVSYSCHRRCLKT